jgi:hypothetical protein
MRRDSSQIGHFGNLKKVWKIFGFLLTRLQVGCSVLYMDTTTTKGNTMNSTQAKILADFAAALTIHSNPMQAAHVVCIDYRDAAAAKWGTEMGTKAFVAAAQTIADAMADALAGAAA